MPRSARPGPVLLLITGLLALVLIASDTAVLLPLILLVALIPLVSGRRSAPASNRHDDEIRARAQYEHHALMLGHDAVGIYGRFQPTPLDPVRRELLPEQLRHTTDPAPTEPNRTTPPPESADVPKTHPIRSEAPEHAAGGTGTDDLPPHAMHPRG